MPLRAADGALLSLVELEGGLVFNAGKACLGAGKLLIATEGVQVVPLHRVPADAESRL